MNSVLIFLTSAIASGAAVFLWGVADYQSRAQGPASPEHSINGHKE